MKPRLRLEFEEGTPAVELEPSSAEVAGPITDLLAARGHALNTRCGGRGLCAGCEVELRQGNLHELHGHAQAQPTADARLRACQWSLPTDGNVTIKVPVRSLLRHEPAVVAEFQVRVPWAHDPLGPGRWGAAIDVGTTTVALLLVDLERGEVVAEASSFNAQIAHGEDVLTRIQLCQQDAAAVERLQAALVRDTLLPLLRETCAEAGIGTEEVGVFSVAGNTTMQHLLAGVNPTSLGVHPFAPVFLEHRTYRAAELGFETGQPDAVVHLLPGPAAYVGADLAAGLVATGFLYEEGPVLLVDVGTNGEIIAKVGDRLLGCATAAGPAFEGAGLSSGTRGVKGAIERVRLRGDPFAAEVDIIGGGTRPLGICGSAYVDFLAEGRQAGVLWENGRFTPEFVARAGDAVEQDEYGRRLRLHPRGQSGPIWVSEVDVARLLQAKAAIAAGIETLLKLLHVEAAAVKTLYLAGGFGLHLSLGHAIGCGLLPGFTPEQIQVVGNTSLGGAFLALNDRNLLTEMSAACTRVESIELNLQPGFEDAYIDHLSLP